MRLDVDSSPLVFDTLGAEWNTLLTASAADCLFLTAEWQATWWAQLGEGELRIVTGRADDGALVGIAPLIAVQEADGQTTLALGGGVEVADYLDIIVRRGAEGMFLTDLLDALAEAPRPWDRLRLANVPASSPTLSILADLARGRGYAVDDQFEDVCPIISLPATWDDYLATLNKHQRHEIRRKLRKIEDEARAEYRRAPAPDALDAALDHFVRLHRLSHTDKARFMDDRMEAFFRAMTRVQGQAGRVELNLLTVDGAPAATMVNFRYGDRLLVYNSGYDPALRPSLSSGIVLLCLCIRDAIERGLRLFDFLQGDEEYKLRFGAQKSEVRTLTVTRT